MTLPIADDAVDVQDPKPSCNVSSWTAAGLPTFGEIAIELYTAFQVVLIGINTLFILPAVDLLY